MKFIFILGGVVGFLTASVTGWWVGRTPDRMLVDGMVGCLAGAILFRWFWGILLRGIQETYVARHRAAMQSASTTPTAVAKTKI